MVVQHCYKEDTGTRRETTVHPKWSPPPPGEVLVSCDAALFEVTRHAAAGVLIRDHTGNCLCACSEPLVGFPTPEVA